MVKKYVLWRSERLESVNSKRSVKCNIPAICFFKKNPSVHLRRLKIVVLTEMLLPATCYKLRKHNPQKEKWQLCSLARSLSVSADKAAVWD